MQNAGTRPGGGTQVRAPSSDRRPAGQQQDDKGKGKGDKGKGKGQKKGGRTVAKVVAKEAIVHRKAEARRD